MLAALAMASGLLGAACERPPSADSLREWTPGDHRSADDDRGPQGQGQMGRQMPMQRPAPGGQAPAPRGDGTSPATPERGRDENDDVASLVDLTWRTQCTSCHGPMGRGDGQMGPMLHAPDLTRADWQSKVTDAEMGATIKGGRDKMPSFNLPDPVIRGLVARIRQTKAP